MVAFSDRITSGYYATKISANRLDTFSTFEQGHLGIFVNYTPHFFFDPTRPTNRRYFDPANLKKLPHIGMLYCHVDMKEDALEKMADEDGVEGIVIAGFGNASENIIQTSEVVRLSGSAQTDIPTKWRENVIPDLLAARNDLIVVRTSVQPYW